MADEPNIVNPSEPGVVDEVKAATAGTESARSLEADDRRAEQDREATETWGGRGIAGLSRAQSAGLTKGLLLGGLVGAIVFLPVGLIHFADIAVGWRLLIVALIGALAGGTAGAVYWGGRQPELNGEMPEESAGPLRG